MRLSLPVPTGRLAALAAAASLLQLVPGVDLPVVPALLGTNAVILALALADAALAVRPSSVGVSREMPATVSLGGELDVVWRVSNPSGRRLSVRVADELAPSLRASTRRVRLSVPARGRATARARLHPVRRGRFKPTDVVVRVDGPLGLAARQHRRELPGSLHVLPRFSSRAEAELRVERARLLEVGLRSAKGRGGGTEIESLREYTPDDEPRRIDWKATARTGKAIVRELRAERNQQVIALLDTGRTMAGRVEGTPRVEHAMDALMALTTVATRLGDRVGLIAYDADVRAVVPPRAGRDQLGRMTSAIFDLEPTLVESDPRGAFGALLARVRRRALLVVLTDLAEEAVAASLLPALPLVLRRHLVIVAGVVDPDVARWASATPGDASGAYRKAAAAAALAGRRDVAARLRAAGAVVIDAPPGEVAPRLCDAYLEIKAVGRL